MDYGMVQHSTTWKMVQLGTWCGADCYELDNSAEWYSLEKIQFEYGAEWYILDNDAQWYDLNKATDSPGTFGGMDVECKRNNETEE